MSDELTSLVIVPPSGEAVALAPAYSLWKTDAGVEYLFDTGQRAEYDRAFAHAASLDAQLYPLRDEYMRLLAEVRRQQAACNDGLGRLLALSLDKRHTGPYAAAAPSAYEALKRMGTLLREIHRVRREFDSLQREVARTLRACDTICYVGRAQRAQLHRYVISPA